MEAFEIAITVFLFLITLGLWLLIFRLWLTSREIGRFFMMLTEEGQPLLREAERIVHSLEKVSSEVEEKVTKTSDEVGHLLTTVENSRERLENIIEKWRRTLSPDNFSGAGLAGSALSLFKYISDFRSKTTQKEVDQDE